jgi:hypothetical protein
VNENERPIPVAVSEPPTPSGLQPPPSTASATPQPREPAAPPPAAPRDTESAPAGPRVLEGAARSSVRYDNGRPETHQLREMPGRVLSAQPHIPRLVVTFERSHSLDADRRRLSDLVDLLERHKGTDRFVIVLESTGQPRYELEFPNSYTRICKELTNELNLRLGSKRWHLE